MGGGGGASTPMPILDTAAVGQGQTAANLGAAINTQQLNQTNQITPYGNLTYSQTGSRTDPTTGMVVPSYTATTSLSPDQQTLLNQSNYQKSNLFNLANNYVPQLQNALNPRMFGDLPDTKAYTDQAYNALQSRGNLAIGQGEDAQRSLNANQGVAAGSTAYNRSFQPFEQSRVDLSNQSTINAQQLADQYFNREVARRGELTREDQVPLSNFMQLISAANGGQPTSPQLVNTPQTQMQAPDVTSPALTQFNAMMQANTAQQQAASKASSGMMSGMFGLGGAAIGAAGIMI